ncbi:UDP-N-acetylmuramate dehydrogenase [Pseudomonas oryzihabitans]|uniref:UDP-N-acetylenolpyruvoylglucosamine reductase n=1 Tax=Pseudomonas oryzihabitans TaxID=47885 RepID=A0A4Y5W4Q3_9PSED|nr:UDP-N-acetylmuramate dehydrogenase [Pseudomonas psychrotolerans]QDD89348.1 UDP-N-acetylenolpyruvoylglucosamine reductase [Pseudomonas psychrotolerans]
MVAELLQGVPLQGLNTFGLIAAADRYLEAASDAEVQEALALARELGVPLRVLGGGSNLVLPERVEGLVLRLISRGIRLLAKEGDALLVEAEAGEPWHPFVMTTLANGWYGLENLSLIPGTVGASPIQNIGAYGVELKDRCAGVTVLDRHSGELQDLAPEDCAFAYRESRFKAEAGRWIVLRVRFHLSRQPQLVVDYGPVRQALAEAGVAQPTPEAVSAAICAIRRSKLPDPAVLGNAGSFFKNPVVTAAAAAALKEGYPGLPTYPQTDGSVKLAAGWLIDQAGWRGYREGAVGVHADQALVLVNFGGASSRDVLALAESIRISVRERFGVTLEMEPGSLT